MITPFRTRSPQRDQKTTFARLASITAVIDKERKRASAELAGLEKRMRDSYDKAAFTLDSAGDYGEREPEDEKRLEELERHGRAAATRLAGLQEEIALYDKLAAILRSP